MTIPLPQLATHSSIGAFRRCPRLYRYKYRDGVRPVEEAQPLRLGSAVHKGIDSYYKGNDASVAIATAIEGYQQKPAWCKTPEQRYEWEIEAVTVANLLNGYFWYWDRPETPPHLRVARVLFSEMAFEVDAPVEGWRDAGKIDRGVVLGDGRVAVKETKTASNPGDDYWARLDLDDQITRYLMVAQAKGIEAVTVLYDVMRKPSMGPRMVPQLDDDGKRIVLDSAGNRVLNKDGKPRQTGSEEEGWKIVGRMETPAEYANRLMADISDRPEWYYERREIPRLSSDIAEYVEDHGGWLRLIEQCVGSGVWPRNTQACVNGRLRCEYLKVCRNGIDPAHPPDGFVRVSEVHPELKE